MSQMPPLLTYIVTRSLGLALQGAFKSLSKFQMHNGAEECAWAGNQETCLPIVCLPLACCLPLPPLFSGSISVHWAGLDFKRQWRAWDSRPSSMTSKMCYLKQLTIPKLHFPHPWNINDTGNWANAIYEFVVCSGQGNMQVKRPCGSTFGAHDTISEAKVASHSSLHLYWGRRGGPGRPGDLLEVAELFGGKVGTGTKLGLEWLKCWTQNLRECQMPSNWDKKHFDEMFFSKKMTLMQTNLWWTKYQHFKQRQGYYCPFSLLPQALMWLPAPLFINWGLCSSWIFVCIKFEIFK